MNSLGLSLIFKMGCLCSRDEIIINNKKYFVKEHIGEGGFSTIELVEDSSTKQKYVVKRIICHSHEDEITALKEVEYHKMVKHPNVIHCVDSAVVLEEKAFATPTSCVFMLLPYYQRGTLADELDRRSKTKHHMDAVELLQMFTDICEGVKAFHEVKPEPLAHRDLKTANIIISNDHKPVIIDLGSVSPARLKICGSSEAQMLQDLASERCSMPFRAPELFNVESFCMVDERTDIWSLGCILYAMCYFKSPFDLVYERGDSVALAVISGKIPFPEQSHYPQELHDLIAFMLNVNPMSRPYIYSVIERAIDIMSQLQVRA